MKITKTYLRQIIKEEVDLYEGADVRGEAFLQKQQGGDQASAAETSTGGAPPEEDAKKLVDVEKMTQYINGINTAQEYERLFKQVIQHATEVPNSKMLLISIAKFAREFSDKNL